LSRIFGLDIIRASAIILVLISHSRFFFRKFYPAIEALSICGYFGVELFFVLSGFLIGRILIRLVSKNGQSIKDLIRFWIMRWMRTLPNYYFFLLLYIFLYFFGILQPRLNHLDFRYFCFSQNLLWQHPHFFPEAWSLAVEEWFYLLFAALLFIFCVFFKAKPKSSVFICIVIFVFFSESLKFYNALFFDLKWDEGFRKVTLLRMDAIMFGVLFAWVDKNFPLFFDKKKNLFLILGAAAIAGCALAYCLGDRDNSLFFKTLYFPITDFFLACLLPFFSKIISYQGLIGEITTFISKISYSMYLLNLSLIFVVLNTYLPFNTAPACIVKFILYWSLTFLLGAVNYSFFEKPILKFRDKIFQRS